MYGKIKERLQHTSTNYSINKKLQELCLKVNYVNSNFVDCSPFFSQYNVKL